MQKIVDAIYEVAESNSSLYKAMILGKHKDLPGFKEILQFIYDPYIRTGIAEKKLYSKKHSISENISYVDVITYFTIHQTGTDNDIHFAWRFINNQCTFYTKSIAIAIVTKNLKIGVTATTLNKVFGKSFIREFDIMLGKKYFDYKDKVKGPWILTEKLDGHRRVILKENGKVTIYSRTGIIDDGLVDIEREAVNLVDNYAYDGEALAIGKFNNSLELRQATNSIMNRDGIKTGVTFNIFDTLPTNEFKRGYSSQTAIFRKMFICSIFNDESIKNLQHRDMSDYLNQFNDYYGIDTNDFVLIKSVPIIDCTYSEEKIIEYAKEIWDRKFEGIMALQQNSIYENKRSKYLLKVKCTESLDLPIVDMIEGTGKYVGLLGSLIVDYKGYRVGVGTGLTDSDRFNFWDNRDSYIGKIVEIDTFGETKNKDGSISLNCSVFKGLRLDK